MAKPLQATRSEEPTPDVVQVFAICERTNQMLLTGLDENVWRAASPTGKGRNIAEIFAHIHNVRLMWLEAAAKELPKPAKLDKSICTRDEVRSHLTESAACVQKLLESSLSEKGGQIKGFRPNAAHFVAYLISHEAHHRGQIALLARQTGFPLSKKLGFAMWEWGTLWRECGFGE